MRRPTGMDALRALTILACGAAIVVCVSGQRPAGQPASADTEQEQAEAMAEMARAIGGMWADIEVYDIPEFASITWEMCPGWECSLSIDCETGELNYDGGPVSEAARAFAKALRDECSRVLE